jgi:hypothetical protein
VPTQNCVSILLAEGGTSLNDSTPGFASSLWALTYAITHRLVFDGGVEAELSNEGPHRHIFARFTHAIANLYPGWRRRRHTLVRDFLVVRAKIQGLRYVGNEVSG